jgi:hypothetical protein
MTATRDLLATLALLALAACLRHPWLQRLATVAVGHWLRGTAVAGGAGGLGPSATRAMLH